MRETGPVRWDFPSDEGGVLPLEYAGLARTLLGALKQRMALGGLAQLARTVTLPDGAVIRVASVHGQDSIRVVRPNVAAGAVVREGRPEVPQAPVLPAPVGGEQIICEWGPNAELYSTPFTTCGFAFAAAAMNTKKDTIYLITGAPSWRNYTNWTGAANASRLVQLDAKLATVASGLGAYPEGPQYGAAACLAYDKATQQFFANVTNPGGFPASQVNNPLYPAHKLAMWSKGGAQQFYDSVDGPHMEGVPPTSTIGGPDIVLSAGTANGVFAVFDNFAPGNNPALANQMTGGGHLQTLATQGATKLAEIKNTGGAGQGGYGGPGYVATFAYVTRAGALVVGVDDGTHQSIAIYTVDARSGGTVASWGTAPADTVVAAARMRVGERELWLATDTGIYKSHGQGWQRVIAAAPRIRFSSEFALYNMLNLAYDEVNDAMAVVLPDASGAWIYGGRDCRGRPLGKFFVKFKHPPDFDGFFCTQFETGTLLVTYLKLDSADPTFTVASTLTVGRYDIGQLNQRQLTI